MKPWFPTYVYEAPLQGKGGADFVGALFDVCQRVRDEDSAGREWCKDNYPSGYTSYETRRDLHRTLPPFVTFERKIWRHVKRFADRLDMDLREANLAMTDCWVNIMSRDAVHPLHVHPGAVVSGTFYVSTPSGCADIHFEDPRFEKFAGTPPRRLDCRPENRQQVSCAVTAGKVVLFESWLRHGVASNSTVDERVSVSFNYTWV
ncbi:MAG: TIGR02466 family protein [Pseudomonadota bacterium]